MRAMISGQRELQEEARWLARRGVAAWASQRRFDPPLPKGLTGWRAGNEASCGRPGGMSPELCACAGLLAVFRSLSSEAGPRHGQGTSRAPLSAPPAWDTHPATRLSCAALMLALR